MALTNLEEVTAASVDLDSILGCLQGVIPSPYATCAADGMPNVTYMSTVQYVDRDRVALSRQFLNKTAANLSENPYRQVMLIDPVTADRYLLDLEYLATETEGTTFAAMRTQLEAIGAQTGMGAGRLRGVDIHRVVACTWASGQLGPPPPRELQRDILRALDELVHRLSAAAGADEAGVVALEGLQDLFGFPHTLLLAPDGDELTVVAHAGYTSAATGHRLPVDDGLLGVAVQRRELVCVPHLTRSRILAEATDAGRADAPSREPEPLRPLALPGPREVQSVAVVPLAANDQLIGVLYLESPTPGTFGVHSQRVLRIVGAHLAATLTAGGAPAAGARDPSHSPASPAPAPTIAVTYYQADDSVFVDGEYVIKGVPGRILWKLLREHDAVGRTQFTNRELRLDEELGLPLGNDNLDSRLVALRRRLMDGAWGITLERVARGRLELRLNAPVALSEVATNGPMRHAHAGGRLAAQ